MKIVMTGGGSGGHITPILAVAHRIKQLNPSVQIVYIGQRGDGLLDVPQADPNIDEVYTVQAGKFRRYSGDGWRQLLDVRTQALNVRDVFRILMGTFQSYSLLGKLKADVIFTRGGFVSVPVAVGGHLRRIPYITHDSDSTPSLANRIIARWAKVHAVALPPEIYPYDQAKTVMTGIPLNNKFVPLTAVLQKQYRQELAVSEYQQVLLVTGGGNGAQRLNHYVVANAKFLLGRFPDLCILHITGRKLTEETSSAYDALGLGNARGRVIIRDFVTDLYRYSGAADIIINRGTATNLAEFALQEVACIAIPAEGLGWNVKKVKVLADRGAIASLTEVQAEQPERLGRLVADLLENDSQRRSLVANLANLAEPNAAEKLADILLKIAKKSETDAARA